MMHVRARGVCKKDGKILLAYFKEKDYYFLPGGHVELGESGASALERECMEEFSARITVSPTPIAILEHSYTHKEEIHHEINLIYEFELLSEIQNQTGHLDFLWVNDISTVRFLPEVLLPFVKQKEFVGTTFFSTLANK